jgi:hypothetical protein
MIEEDKPGWALLANTTVEEHWKEHANAAMGIVGLTMDVIVTHA